MLREQRPNSFGVAGGDPHTKTCRVQMADNVSSDVRKRTLFDSKNWTPSLRLTALRFW
jgi:hypothetical protein